MDSSEVSSKAKGISQPAPGDPVSPDFFHCSRAHLPDNAREINCCPPKTTEADIRDFKFPSFKAARIRPAAHKADPEYIAKFNKALQLRKDLPESDPRNFNQQAAVHCTYCVDSYRQDGHPDKVFQVHYSWLFLPFHRWYLYFFKRMLEKLIGDETFAIPFYTDLGSPFYDPYRNTDHLPPTLVDLNFWPKHPHETNPDQIIHNLNVMYN